MFKSKSFCSVLKRMCEQNSFYVGVDKMKKNITFVHVFKCSFIKWVGAVIFDIFQSTITPLVKFKFQSMNSKIEQEIEEEKNNKMG